MTNKEATQRTNGNNRYRNNNRGPAVRFTNVVKVFDSFSDGYAELLKHIPEIKAYCGEDLLYDAVIGSLLNTVKNNFPSISNPNYPNTIAASIDAHEVGFKTDSNISFGWRETFDRANAKVIFKFRVSFANISTAQKEILTSMEADGWKNVEFTKQGRFWNKSVENRNDRPSYKKNNNNQLPEFISPKREEKKEEEVSNATEVVEEVTTIVVPADPAAENTMTEAFKEAQENKDSE